MPFKVTYSIYDGKAAPCFTSADRRVAYVEFQEQQRTKGYLNVRMTTDVKPDGSLSKQEEYLWLVYRVGRPSTATTTAVARSPSRSRPTT